MSLVEKTETFNLLTTLFPGYRKWVYYESDDRMSIEDIVKTHGKWVIYGSKEYVEGLANSLRGQIGDRIDGIKYSKSPTRVTPNAPYGCYALLVYCHDFNRDDVLSKLKNKGVEEPTWKYDRVSLLEDLSDPSCCFRLGILNYERFKRIVELLGMGMDPEILHRIEDFNNFVKETSAKSRELYKMYKEGVDKETFMQKVKEFSEKLKNKNLSDFPCPNPLKRNNLDEP